jgi:uncharacterized repeat protein (TIGR01451 family)
MQNITTLLKNKYTITLAIFAIAVLGLGVGFGQNTQPAQGSNCPGSAPQHPAFNVWPINYDPSVPCTDAALIDALNTNASGPDGRFAQSQTEHDAGINAKAGDVVEVSIYFHNGASDQISRSQTTAHDVVISSNFSSSPTISHDISGTISASNAGTVNSANLGGDIVVHTASLTTLSYIPGSSTLCISQQHAQERGLSGGSCGSAGQDILVPISDGVASSGFVLGDLKACFPYSGTLDFKVKVNGNSPPVTNVALSITKQVQNVTQGSGFSNSVTAKQGDTVGYKITVTNTDNSITANNVIVTDTGAAGISFVSGTNFSGGGVSAGNLAPNQSQTFSYTANVTASSGSLVNTAAASAANASSVQASATVNVNAVNQNVTLSITKQVQNASQGSGFSNSVTAQQGNILNYRITVTNNSSTGTANNVFVTDSGTFGVTFQSGTNFSNGGVSAGNLAPSQSQTFSYTAIVTASSGTLVNTAQAAANNASSVQASANVFVNGNQQGSLNITKQVANNSRGVSFSSNVNANVGDIVQYQIVVSNFTNSTVNNITVIDNMPFGISFNPGSLSITGSGLINPFNGGNNFSNISISSLAPGQNVVIVFTGTVNQTGTLVNTASASAPSVPTVSATATVIVNGSGGFSQLNISKVIRDITAQGSYAKNISGASGDRVGYQITVNNPSSNTLNNVVLNDQVPSGFSYAFGTTRVDGNLTVDITSNNSRISLGTMFQGQQHVVTFEGTINGSANSTFTNVALVSADNANTVQDSASITLTGVQGANVNLLQSKRAFNDTKGVDATSVAASKQDFITYTLTVTNTGNATAQAYIFQDDLSSVLNNATFVDNGGGGVLNGNTVVFSPVDIPAGATVSKTFRVRVNFFLPNGNVSLINTFGNTVTINVGQVLGAVFVAPKTGPSASLAFGFGAVMTILFAIFRKAFKKQKFVEAFTGIFKR